MPPLYFGVGRLLLRLFLHCLIEFFLWGTAVARPKGDRLQISV